MSKPDGWVERQAGESMSTEQIELNLDGVKTEAALNEKISDLEERSARFVQLKSSVSSLPFAQKTLCAFRASGISALVMVSKPETLGVEELTQTISNLYEWDQLTLKNILVLCRNYLPEGAYEHLDNEARTEWKWMEEWFSASDDPRIHKIPGLPWRSFIRKVVGENYQFASELIALNRDLPEGWEEQRNSLIRNFLKEKKKVICIFPKNRGRK